MNRFSKDPNFHPYHSIYSPYPIDEMIKLGAVRDEKNAQAQTGLDSINDTFLKIGAIPKDTQIRDQEVQKYRDQLNSLVNSDGDLMQKIPQIRKVQQDLSQNLAYGPLSGVQNRYSAYQADAKNITDAIQENRKDSTKGIDSEDGRMELQYNLNSQEDLQKDPITGSWTGYKGTTIGPHIDLHNKMQEYRDKMTPETISAITGLQVQKDNTGYYRYTNGTKTYLEPEVISRALQQMAMSDPTVMKYINHRNEIYGVNKMAKEYLNQTNDQNGPYQPGTSPHEKAHDLLYGGIKEAADAIGVLTQVHENKITQGFEKDFQAENKKQNPEYEFEVPGSGIQIPAETITDTQGRIVPIKTNADYLTKSTQLEKESSDAMKEYNLKLSAGWSPEDQYMKSLKAQSEFSTAKAQAFKNSYAESIRKAPVSPEERQLYIKYKDYKWFGDDPSIVTDNEKTQMINDFMIGTDEKSKAYRAALKMGRLQTSEQPIKDTYTLLPGLVRRGTMGEQLLRDKNVNEMLPGSELLNSKTGEPLNDQERSDLLEGAEKITWAGDSKTAMPGYGKVTGVNITYKDGKKAPTQVYMPAAKGVDRIEAQANPQNTVQIQNIQDQISNQVDNAGFTTGNIIITINGKTHNIGQVQSASDLSPTDNAGRPNPNYSSDRNMIIWSDPTGKPHSMTRAALSVLVNDLYK